MNTALLCGVAVCSMALGAHAASADSERARIASERSAAQASFAARERECQTRFVVTSCVNDARKELQTTLTRLHQQQIVLDEAKRREAAAARQRAIREKADTQDARPSEPEAQTRRETVRHSPQPHPPAWSRSDGAAKRSPGAASAADQHAIEQSNEAKFEARARAAQEHREAVERRNAQRAVEGKAAAPLPVPSAASGR